MSVVPFSNIPQNLRVPLFYAEVNNSQANTGGQNQRSLVIGQMITGSPGVAGAPIICSSPSQATALFGDGSMAALMVAAYRASDSFGELWVLPLADAAGSVAAAGSIDFGTVASAASGVISIYIGGVLVSVPVIPTQTTIQIAAAVTAALNATPNLPISAAVDGTTAHKVDLTALNAGPGGNEIDIRLNYQGSAAGEASPPGIVVTIVPLTGGATPPVLTTPLQNLAETSFDFIAFPYTDATSLNAMKAFLGDQTGRWSWTNQLYGGAFSAYRGTVSALTTFGLARNDQHMSVTGFYDSPTPAWIWAADITGAVAVSLRADPALPLQTLALSTALPPPLPSRFLLTDRNTLLYDGISTFTVGDDGTVRIENQITTYQQNAFGQTDNSYLQVETLYTLSFVLRILATLVTSKYGRMKLAANGTRFGAGANVVTPNIIKADLISQYALLENQGLVQNSAAFNAAIIVVQNANNPNRVDVLYPASLIDGLRTFALLAQFRLT